jgi:hypothetical protein
VTDHLQKDAVLVAMKVWVDSGMGAGVGLLVHYIESLDSLHEERKKEVREMGKLFRRYGKTSLRPYFSPFKLTTVSIIFVLQ